MKIDEFVSRLQKISNEEDGVGTIVVEVDNHWYNLDSVRLAKSKTQGYVVVIESDAS